MFQIRFLLLLIVTLSFGFWGLTQPWQKTPDLTGLDTDPDRGEIVFYAAGCAGCHSAPQAKGEDRLVLAGGQQFNIQFGTFVAPNISMDRDHGIGAWSLFDFTRAVRNGVSPEGKHYYPAFPYASYHHMTDQDIADLWRFWATLPSSDRANEPHDLAIFARWRRPVGIWKLLFSPTPWDNSTPSQARGQYLVQALGHCAECHTPRNILGGLKTNDWMAGAPSPDGKGRIPAITPSALGWSPSDIAAYLKSGFTPDYDVAGGLMAEVIENTSNLSDADLLAIGDYLVNLNQQ